MTEQITENDFSTNVIDRENFQGYRGSITLKKPGTSIDWTPELLHEFIKCSEDPLYFGENYMKIVTEEGLVVPELYEYQRDIITKVWKNSSVIAECARQSGKTTALTVVILWYIIFHKEKTIAILANKGDTAREILGRIKKAYESLPDWLQQGVKEWNKGLIELENGSRIIAAATSADNIRGYSIDFLFIDEAAHIDQWDEFWTAIRPTISSRKNAKLVLVSTVNGLNHFYKFTSLARQKKNDFKLVSVTWQDVPGRDFEWKHKTLSEMNYDYEKFAQEFENEYLGSSGTLILGSKLKQLVSQPPIKHNGDNKSIKLYRPPEVGHQYVLLADTSYGKGLDDSAFHIIDITEMPYRQALVFKDNSTPPAEYADIIYRFAKHYNTCPVLMETNDIGGQVAEMLWDNLAYENMLFTESAGPQRKKVSQSYKLDMEKGLRMTRHVKSVGCSILKVLIEMDRLIIDDESTINELKTFSKKGSSYEAEPGNKDDLVMSLVLFAWLSEDRYFKELTEIDTLYNTREKTEAEIDENLLPLGVSILDSSTYDIDDHLELRKMKDEVWFLADEW